VIDLGDIARRARATDPTLAIEERIKRLRDALAADRVRARVWADEDSPETIVVLLSEPGSDRWTEHRFAPVRPAEPTRPDSELLRDADDATITALADLLEAKYRADCFRREHLRGLPGDASLVHDGFELLFRTWRDSLALSLRAQRGLTRTVRELLPATPRRPMPQVRISGPVELRLYTDPLERQMAPTWAGRFAIRNARATTLEAPLDPKPPGAGEPSIQLSPRAIVLRPGEETYVSVRVVGGRVGTLRLEWGPNSPLAPISLILLEEGR
jgi:hypothetical protein